jgi:hypothetical protein
MASTQTLDQRVPFAPSTKLDVPALIEIGERDNFCFALDRAIIDPSAAAADQPSRVTFGSS